MGRPIFIPREVKDAIAAHIEAAVEKARDGFTSAEEDEDTLTGHLGGLLRIGQQQVDVVDVEQKTRRVWKWSINYYKFRGRGANAMESLIGADGIFEIKLDHGFRIETKSLLFQSKKEWSRDDKLFSQAMKLSTWREAAFVLNFTPKVFEAYRLDDIVQSRGKKSNQINAEALSDVVGKQFPNCTVGDADLHYDAVEKKLVWKDYQGQFVATRFLIGHRLRINVRAPCDGGSKKADTELSHDEIHLHRMEASNEEMLSLDHSAGENEIKAAHKKAALAYHPDKLNNYDDLMKQIGNRRMQEANDAKEALLRKIGR